ncbi:MAG: FAD:protein transferase [Pseudonocardiales bacterium]|jgi:thiamine biosynthesis lipoprotein|nr:FAD:protein transferase [Pseudonocardiales bacterium]
MNLGTTSTPASTAVRLPDAALPTATWSDWSCLVRLVVTDPAALPAAIADLESLMRRVDRAASRFRIDSDLNWANANAGRPVAVSRTLVNLVDTALGEASRSSGALDPTLGRDLVRLGYDRDITLIGNSEDPVEAREAARPSSWRDVQLDRLAGLLTVPPGCALDLGASAKAQTADWAAADLRDRYGCDVLVEIGGDLAVAGRKDDWQITVAEKADQAGQRVSLGPPRRGGVAGMATSTTTIRRWQRGDTEISHIIDPVTGAPAAGPWRTVTVAAASATHANTCSTSAIVLGDEALNWLHTQGVAARLVDRSGEVVTLGGWPC